MNKIFSPLMVILLIAACQDESVSPPNSKDNQSLELRSSENTVSVCHSGTNIHININAVPAHQAHGDAVDMDDDSYFDLPNDCGSGVDCNDNDPTIYPGETEVCEDGIDNNCDGDIDENCIPSVTICDQVWMLKNLDVATYRNGDPIPKVTDDATWNALTTGAYCYYNNDSATYATVYGKLYNWYAVGDPRGLAPEGWHVPSEVEWFALSDCWGGLYVAGGPLKEAGTAHWLSPNYGATNLSGFTGLPGGFRDYFGHFLDLGWSGNWWSSSQNSQFPEIAGSVGLNKFNPFFSVGGASNLIHGFSVRCVKD